MELTSAFLFVTFDTPRVVGVSTDAWTFAFLETACSEITESRSTSRSKAP